MTPSRIAPGLILLTFLAGSLSPASAQSVGPDESVVPDGNLPAGVALSPVQRNAVYDAVRRHRLRTSDFAISPQVGAAVPPFLPLSDLPDAGSLESSGGGFLKYAMVEGDLLVIDPISMRVVDVIHRGTRP